MRLARSTGAISGALIVLLGIWGGLIAFVGPYFNYSFGVNNAWHYTSDRLWLNILPGALAVLGGLMLITARTRVSGIVAGWLALLAGVWFVIGPPVSLTWETGAGPIGRPLFGTTRQMLELVGYFYGLGALIAALAAFAIGRFVSRPREVPVGATAAPAAAPAAVAAERDREAVPYEPVGRRPGRFAFPRRRRAGGATAGARERSAAARDA
jgi:hypothetical protein